jgi:hypothetical protein
VALQACYHFLGLGRLSFTVYHWEQHGGWSFGVLCKPQPLDWLRLLHMGRARVSNATSVLIHTFPFLSRHRRIVDFYNAPEDRTISAELRSLRAHSPRAATLRILRQPDPLRARLRNRALHHEAFELAHGRDERFYI